MPRIAAYDDVKAGRTRREIPGGYAWRTEFMMPPKDNFTQPHAYLAERSSGNVLRTHYHVIDQFQIIVSGGGVMGKHKLAIPAVHFSRAYTPYGPLIPNKDDVGFITLRPRRDTGASFLPEANEKLKNTPGRKPWQATELPVFGGAADVAVQPFSRIQADDGLAAFALTLKPGASTTAPSPAGTNGQFLIVTKGSLVHDGKHHKALTIVQVNADEAPFNLQAGADGMELLALNFPRESARPTIANVPLVSSKSGARVLQCQLCAFVYDEALGMPTDGLPPGTRWEDVPADWVCPDCATGKSEFS